MSGFVEYRQGSDRSKATHSETCSALNVDVKGHEAVRHLVSRHDIFRLFSKCGYACLHLIYFNINQCNTYGGGSRDAYRDLVGEPGGKYNSVGLGLDGKIILIGCEGANYIDLAQDREKCGLL
jgi:hypothetical protein